MKKLLKIFSVLLLFIIFPLSISAISKDYKDIVYDITGTETKNDKINFYLFHGQECPHCKEERKWLESIETKYQDKVDFYYFEVYHSGENTDYMNQLLKKIGSSRRSIPCTIIGEKVFYGFSDTIADQIEQKINYYITEEKEEDSKIKLPVLGKVNAKKVSIPLIAIILGFIDGFNPCAMWILLFLINMLINMEDKKKRWILGITFLFVSGLVYFLSMLGISVVLGITAVTFIKIIIGFFALIAGTINIYNYIKSLKDKTGCTVVDDKKRKKIFTKIKKLTSQKSFYLAMIGIIALAISVNLIELACSLGFPMVFTEILAINNINGLSRIIYLLLYILLYMGDDIVIFVISMLTLEATGLTNKYSKYSHLIGGIIMILMGILLIFKPDWLMLNFG